MNRTVLMINTQPSATYAESWEVWPDEAILGNVPGKELRRFLGRRPTGARMLIHHQWNDHELSPTPEHQNVVLFGLFVSRAKNIPASAGPNYWLIHPTVPPPKLNAFFQSGKFITVILPEIDETGLNDIWKSWSENVHAKVVYSPQSGLDIRAVWPDFFQTLL